MNDRIGYAIALAPRHRKKVAAPFLDLDGFKHINDSLGHPIGDRLLQLIARCWWNVCAAPTGSRQGGDEFIVLLSELQRSEDAAIHGQEILHAVAAAHSIDLHDLHVTTSIGVSVYPDDGLDAETLIKNADTAMYQAKTAARAISFSSPPTECSARSSNRLRRASAAPWNAGIHIAISRRSISRPGMSRAPRR